MPDQTELFQAPAPAPKPAVPGFVLDPVKWWPSTRLDSGELVLGQAVAFKGNFAIHRGTVGILSNGRPGVVTDDVKQGAGFIGFPLHDGWRPDAEVLEPRLQGPAAYTLETLAGIVGDAIGFVDPSLVLRVAQTINQLRGSIAAGNIDPDSASANQAAEKQLIGSLQGGLCRYANACLALGKGYKRGKQSRVDEDRALLDESLAEADLFLREIAELEELISRDR